jgi:hypothetical protein
MKRCRKTNSSSTGTLAITAPAMSRSYRTALADWSVLSPAGSVCTSALNSTYTGHRKSFQFVRNASSASVASAGFESGTMTRRKMSHRFAPSRIAASSSSLGRLRKNWRMKNTPNADAAVGTMIATSEFSQPRLPAMR